MTASTHAEPPAGEQAEPASAGPEPTPAAEPSASNQRTWSLPKTPDTRKLVDELGRIALKSLTGLAASLAAIARIAAHTATQLARGVGQIPASLRLLLVLGVLTLVGIVGSITLTGTPGLLCAVVVVPVLSIAVGVFGHHWYIGHRGAQAAPRAHAAPDLARSMTYVDSKLTLALNTFGSERHQHAVIALFQAKTAVELALGTEHDSVMPLGAPAPHRLRPRIQAGSASQVPMPESNTLAAS